MNKKNIRHYCSQVGKSLCCRRLHKKQLLSGLKQELEERTFSEPVTLQELYDEVGTPGVVAEQLMESVDPTEREAFARRRKLRPVLILLAVIAVLVSITVGYLIYWERGRIDHEVTYIIYGNPEDSSLIDTEGFATGPLVTESEDPLTFWGLK